MEGEASAKKPEGTGADESISVDSTGDTKAVYRADGVRHVEKGSLTEAELLLAKMQAKPNKDRHLMTEEEIKAERRAANRLSAFQSRQRKKSIIEDLQKTVSTMTKDNAAQHKKIQNYTKEIASLKSENERLRGELGCPLPSKNNPASDATPRSNPQELLLNLLKGSGAGVATSPSTGGMPPSNEVASLLTELSTIDQYIRALGSTNAAVSQLAGVSAATTTATVPQQQPILPPQISWQGLQAQAVASQQQPTLQLQQQQQQIQQQQQLAYLMRSDRQRQQGNPNPN